jgi:ubiquinone/menaquinone biosynthesis C-methylase UbiE
MQSLSGHNKTISFGADLKQSRILKMNSIINSLKPGKLLDIGCLDGDWASQWLKKGWECYGVDINEKFIKNNILKGIIAKKCDLSKEKLPWDDNSFDLIVAGEIIEHLIDTDSFLLDLNRCLKKDGYLLITTPNLTSFENRFRMLLGKYPNWVEYRLGEGSGHVRIYTAQVLIAQLEEHGFNKEKLVGDYVPFLFERFVNDIKWPFLSITGNLFPTLSRDLIVLAKKVK